MHLSCSKDYVGNILGIRTGALARGLSEELALSRSDTLLTASASIGRSSAELKTILGNANSRLKSGAVLVPILGEDIDKENTTILEQAKPRARVELDIALESNVCVQDGYLKGHIKVRIRKHSKKDHPVLVSGGKVRAIGFECIMNENERLAFYQVSEVASGLGSLYVFEPDGEGFCRAIDGIYSFPFALHLPLSSEYGTPKGVMHSRCGISVQYIAMVSLRVKDAISGRKSISHFYRDCSIWPRLNPSVILAPLPRPLQMTVSGSLSMGGNNGIQLTASLHRLHWIAGQACQVKITIINNSKKNIKNLTLGIYRSTIIFQPKVPLEDLPDNRSTGADPDAWQTSATKKKVAESTLVVGERGTRGHASAKGWWTGVGPGKSMTFSHFISIPPDALSIPRGKLLEVLYVLRVTISPGSLLPTDVHATLPLHIVNLLSIDPPVSSPQSPSTLLNLNSSNVETLPVFNQRIDADSGRSEVDLIEEPMEDEDSSYSDDDIHNDSENPVKYGGHDRANLSLHDDTDEVVQYAVASASIDVDYAENAPRFADLYYSSLQENLDRAAERYAQGAMDKSVSQIPKSDETGGPCNNFASRVREKTLSRQSERRYQPQESYAEKSEAEAAMFDELDTIHGGDQSPYSHQPSSYIHAKSRTADHPDPTCASCSHHVALATAPSKFATRIPPPTSQLGHRSSQLSENPYIHAEKQDPALNDAHNTPIVYGLDSTPTSTSSRSRSVKDKIKELEERVERANTNT
ncbi:hypothetical protein BYT27DRAFT_6591127 [Phlegmacium glaucopus]|nr:hypothetical protein BYT27DRAFT_6591127 [Phlegmacium glaucopus]